MRNVIERGAVLAEGTTLRVADLPEEIKARRAEPVFRRTEAPMREVRESLSVPYLADFRQARCEFERAYLERCLAETGGNVTRAAERIGMHRQSLQQKLKDLGLTRRYVAEDELPDSDEA